MAGLAEGPRLTEYSIIRVDKLQCFDVQGVDEKAVQVFGHVHVNLLHKINYSSSDLLEFAKNTPKPCLIKVDLHETWDSDGAT